MVAGKSLGKARSGGSRRQASREARTDAEEAESIVPFEDTHKHIQPSVPNPASHTISSLGSGTAEPEAQQATQIQRAPLHSSSSRDPAGSARFQAPPSLLGALLSNAAVSTNSSISEDLLDKLTSTEGCRSEEPNEEGLKSPPPERAVEEGLKRPIADQAIEGGIKSPSADRATEEGLENLAADEPPTKSGMTDTPADAGSGSGSDSGERTFRSCRHYFWRE